MATSTIVADRSAGADRLDVGAKLMAFAGLAVLLYGVLILVLNFTSFIELGLTPQLTGGNSAAILAFSPGLHNYISHLQVALAAFLIAYALQLMALAWYGVRRGESWALRVAIVSTAAAYVIGVPLHFVYGLATPLHLGPFGLVAIMFTVGAALASRGMSTPVAARGGRA